MKSEYLLITFIVLIVGFTIYSVEIHRSETYSPYKTKEVQIPKEFPAGIPEEVSSPEELISQNTYNIHEIPKSYTYDLGNVTNNGLIDIQIGKFANMFNPDSYSKHMKRESVKADMNEYNEWKRNQFPDYN